MLKFSVLFSTLIGTKSTVDLSSGNTYPAIALPWGMNFWTSVLVFPPHQFGIERRLPAATDKTNPVK